MANTETKTVLLTGAAGFVGTPVVARLLEHGVRVRAVVHRAEVAPGAEAVPADLARPGSLAGLCRGVDAVVHLASRIGGTEQECRAVNTGGTAALVAEAHRAGVRRFVQLGTAAVYGEGPHRGPAEGGLAEAPGSVTSATRLAGERLVLAAGGTVVRPHMVFGRGDRWVIPSLVSLLARLPHWVDGGRARISMLSVDALAGALAELALSPQEAPGVLHAAHPEPVTARDLVCTVTQALGLPLPQGETDMRGALDLLEGGAGPDAMLRRRLSLLAVDHWYDSSRLWDGLNCRPGPAFSAAFSPYADWYRAELTG
ncbi:NAD-dependent epimerase/dehydratase family protein [Streptomyces sp. JL4002]|uniref:NAD-dependent epimerase/dehydratase family protein n=1 Tax=Streptomyces TaxID=1883 RepID=UPI003B284B9E